MHQDYMISFHGMDIGLVYNLPKNVRVVMYCLPGKTVSACDANEARTWYVATTPRRDLRGNYLKALKIFWDENKKALPYCVFSGNLQKYDMNRIPDILLKPEFNDFKTGLFHLPARFNKVYLKDGICKTTGKSHQTGDIEKVDYRQFHKSIANHTNAHVNFDEHSFIHHFLRPGTLKKRRLGTLGFVVVPQTNTYWSHAKLTEATRRLKRKSTPNTKTSKDIAVVREIATREKGLHLSDVIRTLIRANPDQFITLVVTVCRSFHDELPQRVRANQEQTSRITIQEYLKNYASIDTCAFYN